MSEVAQAMRLVETKLFLILTVIVWNKSVINGYWFNFGSKIFKIEKLKSYLLFANDNLLNIFSWFLEQINIMIKHPMLPQ